MVASCIGIRSSAGCTTILFLDVLLVLLVSSSFPTSAASAIVIGGGNGTRATSRSVDDLIRLQSIEAQLARVMNVSVKTIQSPDGDVIDCVPTHLQPAFEHPKLRGLKPESEPVERPRITADHEHGDAGACKELGLAQVWMRSGESCPDGTIPVRRTTVSDLLRASLARRWFGTKTHNTDPRDFGHEHSLAGMGGSAIYGAKASLNVWPAHVASPEEFSLAQIWVSAGTYGDDLNTIETGWQVYPSMNGDSRPRLFVFWTSNAYRTGCYNLECPGFVQTGNHIVIGGALSGVSSYDGPQFDINVVVWKDQQQGNWWLNVDGEAVGYWPSALFTHLTAHAEVVHFGGEVATAPRPEGGPHTRTQMGSGQFASVGYRRAAYFRNVEVFSDGSFVPAAGLQFHASHPGCYDVAEGRGRSEWGAHFYYGGPGRNIHCQ